MDETHVEVEVRVDAEVALRLQRVAEIAGVSTSQASSVVLALWCVHNLPTQPE